MLAEEPRLAYDRVNLSKFFSGSSVEDLTLTTREFFDKNGIELHSGDPVAAHRPRQQARHDARAAPNTNTTSCARHGLDPVRAADPGHATGPAVRLSHHRGSRSHSPTPARTPSAAWSIGGGLLGLEAAKALNDLGLRPTWSSSRRG